MLSEMYSSRQHLSIDLKTMKPRPQT